MPFGPFSALATFQNLMNTIFKPYLRRFMLVFFNDILIYNKEFKDHIWHLRVVLNLLLDNHLVVNQKKCLFAQDKIEYLGHIVSKSGVKVDPHKVSDMKNWASLRYIKELKGFLGLTGYYRKFVRGYGKIVKPLT